MSSASALYGSPDISVYSATKHAISALTEALDVELEKSGIQICDIRPPYVNTPLLDTPEDVYSIEKMGINIEPEEIAKTIWKAVHKHKLHWDIGPLGFLRFIFWIFPFLKRKIVKNLGIPPK